MIRVSVLYASDAEQTFDDRYNPTKHTPMANGFLKSVRYEID